MNRELKKRLDLLEEDLRKLKLQRNEIQKQIDYTQGDINKLLREEADNEGKKIVNMLDHIKDPIDNSTIQACFHLLTVIPILEDEIINVLCDKLDDANLFNRNTKRELNFVRQRLDSLAKEKWAKMDDMQEGDTKPEMFGYDLTQKVAAELVKYTSRLVKIADIKDQDDYQKVILDNEIFMHRLEPGDVFTFTDDQNYMEYTFVGKRMIDKELVLDYKKSNTRLGEPEISLVEYNLHRPVIKVTINDARS